MKAVILAAGIASRLRPLTDTTPKCLLKIGERCLLERAFDALIQNGFNEFIIVTGYRQQQIVDFLQAHYPAQSITFIYNDKYESTNNIYSLWLPRPYTEREEVLLLDSDIVFDVRLILQEIFTADVIFLGFENHLKASIALTDIDVKTFVAQPSYCICDVAPAGRRFQNRMDVFPADFIQHFFNERFRRWPEPLVVGEHIGSSSCFQNSFLH